MRTSISAHARERGGFGAVSYTHLDVYKRQVWLLGSHPIPKFSRYVQRSFPWPGADHEDAVASIIDVATQYGLNGWVLLATGDEDMRLIAQNHALLARHFRVVTASCCLLYTSRCV